MRNQALRDRAMKVEDLQEGAKSYFKYLIFIFGFVFLVLNIFSLFFDFSSEPFGGFLGQSIFVVCLTTFNFVFASRRSVGKGDAK